MWKKAYFDYLKMWIWDIPLCFVKKWVIIHLCFVIFGVFVIRNRLGESGRWSIGLPVVDGVTRGQVRMVGQGLGWSWSWTVGLPVGPGWLVRVGASVWGTVDDVVQDSWVEMELPVGEDLVDRSSWTV